MLKTAFKFISLSSSLLVLSVLSSCSKNNSQKDSAQKNLLPVTVYSYDSFAGEWGAASSIAELFKEKTGYTLNVINCDQAVSVLARAIDEKQNVQADVILGLDQSLALKAISEDILEPFECENKNDIDARLFEELGGKNYLTPFDYSHFAIIYDTKSSVTPPASLTDLTKDEYKNKIVLIDPRTSSVGLGFLAWTQAVFGDDVVSYWKALAPNILTMTPGWSASWGMFKKGEAPLVVSYTTSPASLVEYDGEDWAQALIFEHGHVEQVEGVGILKNAPNKEGAKAFINFFTGLEAQKLLPLTQWMNPANKKTELPQSYLKKEAVVTKTLKTDAAKTSQIIDDVIDALGK